MKSKRLILLCLVLAAQFLVPLQMIRTREAVLDHGVAYRFKTRPVDPADPFRGRYVRLDFEADSVPCAEEEANAAPYGARIYAVLGEGAEGFARFESWSTERPQSGDYLKTRLRGPVHRWDRELGKSEFRGLRIELPFDRFYMEESKAPKAERIAADATRGEDCWAVVRVLDGRAVIEDVFVDGRPIGERVAD